MVSVDEELIRHFGSNVREARERAGITVDALAFRAGIAAPLLRLIEQGNAAACDVLDLQSLFRLARSLGQSAALLLRPR